MAKVSIGLRGWRFEESEVFDESGDYRPFGEMPPDARQRLARLQALVTSPCHACWLIHGDENVAECNVGAAVYGEPLAEVLVCEDHESDFLYWYREAGGSEFRGTDEFQDEFHEWFAGGGRAPEGYGSVEHVDTDPASLPNPTVETGAEAASGGDPDADDLGDVDLSQDYPG